MHLLCMLPNRDSFSVSSIGLGKSCEVKDCFVSFSVEENCEQFLAGQVTILAGHHPLRPASRLF